MKSLVTERDEFFHCTNDLTREMDAYLKSTNKYESTYIYDAPVGNNWLIRYPGATRGRIKVDANMVIIEIELYDDEYHTDDIYRPGIRECFEKYVGMKLVFQN